MLSTFELSNLLTPVMSRALADGEVKINGFPDRSASFVLERLGFNIRDSDTRQDFDNEAVLARCAWIDQQLLHYFNKHQSAEGTEIESGLSTRFHRLSEQMDWPCFSWCMINSFDVNDCLGFIFPALDNHRAIGCDSPRSCWHKYIHWQTSVRKIVIFAENGRAYQATDFLELYSVVQNNLTPATPVLDLIIRHDIPELETFCEKHTLSVNINACIQEKPYQPNVLLRFLGLSSRDEKKDASYTHHIQIT